MGGTDCLYLISSSSTREYVRDCLEVLALPDGSVQHFRYRVNHLDPAVAAIIPDKPGSLGPPYIGMSVVPVFLSVSRSADGTWASGNKYVPLRFGTLLDAFRDGNIAHFFFQVGRYIEYEAGPVSKPSEVISGDFIRYFADKHVERYFGLIRPDRLSPAPHNREAYAFQSFVENAYVPAEWRTVSSGESPMDITYAAIFFRVAGVFEQSESGDDLSLSDVPSNLRKVPGAPYAEYVLNKGSVYRIKIATHHHESLSPAELPGQGDAELVLSFDADVFDALGPTSLVIASPYDLEHWALVPRVEGRQSALRISCRASRAEASERYVRRELLSANVSLPIRITPHGKRKGTSDAV